MATNEPLDFTQPTNKLSQIADAQRAILFPKNDFKQTANEYSSVNPDALADGDVDGKGTGNFLMFIMREQEQSKIFLREKQKLY